MCVHPCAEFVGKTKLRNRVDFGRKIKIKKFSIIILKKIYGNYMKMPPEAERVNHMPLVIQFEGEEPIYESK